MICTKKILLPFVHQCFAQCMRIQLGRVQLALIVIAGPHPKDKDLDALTSREPTHCTHHQPHVPRPTYTDLRNDPATLRLW